MQWEEIREQVLGELSTLIAPAMAASLVVMLVIRWLGGKRVGALATVLAVTAAVFVGLSGIVVANNLSSLVPWQLDPDPNRPWDVCEFAERLPRALWWSLEEEKPKPAPEEGEERAAEVVRPMNPNCRTRYWLPWLAGLAMLIEFLLPLPRVPSGPGWSLRTVIALLAARLLTPNTQRMEEPWVWWALGAVILLEWALLTALARRWRDGTVPTSLGLCCIAAALVLKEVHLSACEWALLLGSSMAGPALVSWKWPSDTSPAAAACAVILPSLLLDSEYNYLDKVVPLWSFLLAGLAPLALLPVWLPFLARRERWIRWVLWLSLPLIPAVTAAVWAVQVTLPGTE
jgi:hypothetical protein